jgi:hypothetical protein
MGLYHTVTVKGDPVRGEDKATAVAILPGHLIEYTAANVVQKHSTPGGVAEKMFALENELLGKGISDAYDASSLIQWGIFKTGDEVNARVTGSPAIGAKLSSNGDGTLKRATADSAAMTIEEAPIAVAIEAVTSGLQLVRIL